MARDELDSMILGIESMRRIDGVDRTEKLLLPMLRRYERSFKHISIFPFQCVPDLLLSSCMIYRCEEVRSLMKPMGSDQHLLSSMATAAPANVLLRPPAWSVTSALIDGGVITHSIITTIKRHAVGVSEFLAPHIGQPTGIPIEARNILKSLLDKAHRCCQSSASGPTGRQKGPDLTNSNKITLAQPPADRAPLTWGQEEAFLRTGVWIGPELGPNSPPWQSTPLGGSGVIRPLRLYAADQNSTSDKAARCTKHKESTQRLLPGCLFGWCLDCGVSPGFTLMANAESPRTVFEWLYTRNDSPPSVIFYDNGCNAHQFCLNREPFHFASTLWYVDAFHYAGNNKCSAEYCSVNCSDVQNSSMAEQKNSIIRSLESNCGYMTQLVFLWYVRFFVHRMNVVQREKSMSPSTCFFSQKQGKHRGG